MKTGIELIAHSPDELPPRWTGNSPSPEHWYFCKVKTLISGQVTVDVTTYDFEYGKWLFLRHGEELVEWYSEKPITE